MEVPAKKRKRNNSIRKWNSSEVEMLLDYLEESNGFEVPTAQIFYRKFLDSSGINCTWDLCKWKVRNLRTSYQKAEDWRNSTGAGLLESDQEILSINTKLRKKCPYYQRLKQIFGTKNAHESAEFIIETDSSQCASQPVIICDEDTIIDFDEIPHPVPVNNVEEVPIELEISNSSMPEAPPSDANIGANNPKMKKIDEFAEKMKASAPKNAVSQIAAVQKERTDLLKSRIELEKLKTEKELEISERRLKLDEERNLRIEERALKELELEREKLALRMEEIKRDERIRTLEIEKDERLAKLKLELKYNLKK